MTSRRLSVLVVIHSRRTLRLVASALLSEGHHIYIAASGAEALVHFTPHRCDLVVTDFDFASPDGFELAECIRRRSPAQRILFLAGEAGRRLADGTSRDVEMLFGEPFTLEAVASAVRQLGDQRTPASFATV